MPDYRKIIHIDMDAFFASVEQRDHPEFRGKPVAVGGSGKRGVVAAASYEARKFGVHSALSGKIAKQRCPTIIFVKPRFEIYKEVSMQLRKIFFEYTNLVEPLSLDEAYLDVTLPKKGKPSATLIAKEIKERITEKTKLTASAGISINKFLAKIASDYDKPNGLFLIKPESAEEFVKQLAIEKFFGIGKVTAKKMHELGIKTGKELKEFSEIKLIKLFGKQGSYYYHIARAIDNRPVIAHRKRKSVGAENTFEEDLIEKKDLEYELHKISLILIQRIEKSDFKGRTLTLKIKYADFHQITRSKTFLKKLDKFDFLWENTLSIFRKMDHFEQKIRLLGISVSNEETMTLPSHPIQLSFDF